MPNVSQLTRRQAEKVAGVSRATLARYVADGRLSASKDENGHNVYDAAELARVFSDSFDVKRLEEVETGEDPDSEQPKCPPDTGDRYTRLAVLQVEKAAGGARKVPDLRSRAASLPIRVAAGLLGIAGARQHDRAARSARIRARPRH